VDGDGSSDIVERSAWWRQGAGWERHAFDFAVGADVVTGLAAHQYGLSWFERLGLGRYARVSGKPMARSHAGVGSMSLRACKSNSPITNAASQHSSCLSLSICC